jgi:hypothetical protein
MATILHGAILYFKSALLFGVSTLKKLTVEYLIQIAGKSLCLKSCHLFIEKGWCVIKVMNPLQYRQLWPDSQFVKQTSKIDLKVLLYFHLTVSLSFQGTTSILHEVFFEFHFYK